MRKGLYWIGGLFCFLLFFRCLSIKTEAAEITKDVLRVGFSPEGIFMTEENGVKTGYGYTIVTKDLFLVGMLLIIGGLLLYLLSVRRRAERQKAITNEIIDILGTVVEYRSVESGQHVKRVKGFTKILGKYMLKAHPEYGLTRQKLDIIVSASALHDVGKVAISDEILLKPGKLTPEEYEVMKEHTVKGSDILNHLYSIMEPEYARISHEICRYHHERFDGRGYPDRLSGDEIPISAQLVSIADVYDALTNERCYKAAFSAEEAFQMILEGQCGSFSPKLLEGLKNTKEEFIQCSKNYK